MARRVSWVKGALRDFESFPGAEKDREVFALRMAANGEKADTAKPLKGLGRGVLEIAIRHCGDAFQVVYAQQSGVDL